ncbi:MAG TPA: carboxypeptidase regulatory-like domain-containing protein [Terracidiphilus sp.]|nr:carboxypeptidase regulatory-like domain-containing protein [Terracidiphilus sp.]
MRLKKLVYLLALLMIAPLARAQNEASIGGTVRDTTGAAIQNATVTLISHEQGTVRSATTNGAGDYQFSFLPSGTYDVKVSSAGFKDLAVHNVVLAVAQAMRRNFSLEVGANTESVTVSAEDNLIDANDPTLSTVINNKTVVEMPLNGRLFYSLAPLTPGVMPSPASSTNSTRGGFNITGSCDVCNVYTLNGFFNDDLAIGTPSVRPSVDAIQEFNILTGVYGAQYGYNSGGQILTITKSGTNHFHGSAFGFFRDSALDARNYFSTSQPSFHRNQWGATVGGPIQKDKTFFFFAYEGLSLTQAVVQQQSYPFPEMHTGDFSAIPIPAAPGDPGIQLKNPYTNAPYANNVITDAPSSAGLALMNLYPTDGVNHTASASSSTMGQPLNDYTFQQVRPENYTSYSVKVDHSFSSRDSAFATWNYYHDTSRETGATLAAGCIAYYVPQFTCSGNHNDQLYGLSETHIFTPNLINEARVGLLWSATDNRIDTARTDFWGPYGVTPLISPTADETRVGTKGYPNTTITGITTFGSGNSSYYRIPVWDWYDALSWTHGRHTVKFGAEVLHLAINNINLGSQAGTLAFTSTNKGPTTGYALADLYLGLPASSGNTPYKYQIYYREASLGFFVQDDFKVTPALTLNLGLRWEMNTPPIDLSNNLASFDPETGLPAIQKGGMTPNIPNPTPYETLPTQSVWRADKSDWAPRIGFAYQPSFLRGTIIRGGAGTYYSSPINLNNINGYPGAVPYTVNNKFTSSTASPLTLDDPFPAAGASVTNSPTGVSLNYSNPRSYTYTLGVQQPLTHSLILDTLYVGSIQNHLRSTFNINQPAPGPGTPAQVTARSPYPAFGPITFTQFGFNARYSSLQMKLSQTATKNLSLLLSWVYSHSIDDLGPFTDQSNRETGAGSSTFDIRHRIVASAVYSLPFGVGQSYVNHGVAAAIVGGWQISPMVQWQTGVPLTATLSGNYSNTNSSTTDRPNLLENPNAHAPHTVREWFDTTAFQVPNSASSSDPSYTFGNEPRSTIIGPGLTTMDLSLVRHIQVRKLFTTELRFEAFDLFNHPNWATPGLVANSSGFGVITSTVTQQNQTGGDKRSLQLAIKATF